MILEMDIGNTRTKWRAFRNDQPFRDVSINFTFEHSEELFREIADLNPEFSKVRIANVKGLGVEEKTRHWVAKYLNIEAEFAVSSAVCGKVSSGYNDPLKLGVDRWLAVVAAFHHYRDACCVVDCGSTLTIDLVDGHGLHRGGYIVPGFAMLRRMLCRDTGQIRLDKPPAYDSLAPGCDTYSAVDHGALLMLVSFVQGVASTKNYKLILTGGDAHTLMQYLPIAVIEEGLVLNGLSIALP